VHVNPCHVITSLSAANSVEATTCVAVQLRRNTTDPRNAYYGRSPPPLISTTNYSLSAVGMLVHIYKCHLTSRRSEQTKEPQTRRNISRLDAKALDDKFHSRFYFRKSRTPQRPRRFVYKMCVVKRKNGEI